MAAQTQHPMKEQLLDSPDSAERSFRRSSRGSIKTRLALGLSACALLATGLLLCAQFYSDPLLLEVSQASEDVDTALKTTLWDRAVAWTGAHARRHAHAQSRPSSRGYLKHTSHWFGFACRH